MEGVARYTASECHAYLQLGCYSARDGVRHLLVPKLELNFMAQSPAGNTDFDVLQIYISSLQEHIVRSRIVNCLELHSKTSKRP